MKSLIVLLPAYASAAWGQCPVSYTAQRSITVNSGKVTGTLLSYPMLVLNPTSGLADPNNLKTSANGGRVTSANGYDIIFVNAAGTLLPFELVGHGQPYTSYVPTTGNAEFHVNLASIADGTVIYMCYGNSAVTTYQGNDSGTWSNGAAIWHFPDNATLLDSMGGVAMIPTASPTLATGQIGGALGTNGTSQYAGNTSSIITNTASPLLVSAWAYPTSTSAGAHNIFATGRAGSFRFQLRRDAGDWACYILDTVSSFQSAKYVGGVTSNAWAHVACNWDGSNMHLYVNGVKRATTACATTYASAASNVNSWGTDTPDGAGNFWNGSIDEGRIYNSAKSDAWVTAEYNNGFAPGSFYTVGSETAPQVTSTMSITPAAIPNGHPGNITLMLTGTGTNWSNANTVFTIAGVSNVTKISQNVPSPTAAILVLTTGAGTGSLNIAETVTGATSKSVTVAVPSFSIDVGRGNLSSIQTLTLTGVNTVWSQETAAGLFTVAGGSGASIATPAITANTAGTVQLTVGTLAGSLTIADTSTGKTATFAAGGSAGPSGCAVVLAQ